MNCSSVGCTGIVVYTTSGLCVRCYRRAWAAARRQPAKARPTTEQRFWAKVNKDGPTQPHMDSPCWIWTGTLRPDGYGVINVRGRVSRTHRLCFELSGNTIPSGSLLIHRCDNPPCCNPGHLRIGTNADNMRDMGDKGRSKFHKTLFVGEAHGMSKLTADKVRAMRARRVEGATFAQLAAEFGVTVGAAHFVISGKTWAHVV